MADPKTSRGYRNKNPGNIDWNPKNKWQGQVGIETTGNPPRFAVFESHEFGIRALAVLLTTYFDRHNLRTVRAIINRWAPTNENNTSAYVAGVARMVGVGPNDPLDLHTHAHMKPIVVGIITHELGGNPYTDAVIDEGLRRAGIVKPVDTMKEAARTRSGAAAVNAATLTSAAGIAAPVLTSLGGWPWQATVVLVLAAAILAVVWQLNKRKEQ